MLANYGSVLETTGTLKNRVGLKCVLSLINQPGERLAAFSSLGAPPVSDPAKKQENKLFAISAIPMGTGPRVDSLAGVPADTTYKSPDTEQEVFES